MFVRSTKASQKIVVPTLNMTARVVEIKRRAVRLAIDAPHDVSVLDERVPNRAAEQVEEKIRPVQRAAVGGRLADRLRTTGVGLGLLRLQLDAGLIKEARAAVAALQRDFQLLLRRPSSL